MSREDYWKERNEIKEFRELYWLWYRECVKRFSQRFIGSNKQNFTQHAFRKLLEQYDSLETAREAMFTVDLPQTEAEPDTMLATKSIELPEISTTASED